MVYDSYVINFMGFTFMVQNSVFQAVTAMVIGPDRSKAVIESWGNECCIPEPNAVASGEDLYASFRLWASEKGSPVCTERVFLLTLAAAEIPKTMRKGKRVWLGLLVKPAYRANGAFDFAQRSTDWIDDLKDKVADWYLKECYFDPRAQSWSDDLYEEFTKWHGGERVGRTGFGTALRDITANKGITRHERQPRVVQGKQLMRTLWSGLGMRKMLKPVAPPGSIDAYTEEDYEADI